MTRSNNRSFGASMGAGCVRGVVTDPNGSIVESGVRTISPSEDPLASAASITQEISQWFGHESPVLVVADHTGSSAIDPYAIDGVRLVGEIDAVLAGLRTSGLVGDARTVIIVDVGRVGSRVHTVDSGTGEVFASARTDEFSGDTCDLAIFEHLMSTYGAAEKLTDSSVARVSKDATIAKELLSTTRSVDLSGPFVGNTVRLRSTVVDELMAPSLAVLVALVSDALTPTVDGIAVVGGGANMPAVQRAIMAVTGVPVVVPPSPELFAAVGAARLSTVIPVRTPAATPDSDPDTEVFAPVVPETAAVLAAPAVLSVPAPFEAEAAAFAAEQPMAYAAAETTEAPAALRRPAIKNSRKPRVAAYLGGCAVAAVALISVLTAASASTGAESEAKTPPSTVSASLVPTMAFSVPQTSVPQTSGAPTSESTTSESIPPTESQSETADLAAPPADTTTTGGDATSRDRPTRATTARTTTPDAAPAPTFQAPNRPPQGGSGSAPTTTKAAPTTTTSTAATPTAAPVTTTKTTTSTKQTTTSKATTTPRSAAQ